METPALMLLGIVVTIAIPLGLAWANGQFVGQREAPKWARPAAIGVAFAGVAWCAVPFLLDRLSALSEQADLPSLVVAILALAWVAGSCIAALVALQDHRG